METKLPQIDSIEIIELLGTGGMSLVYKARQRQLDRIVAVKVLSKDAIRGEDGIKRFHNEAKLTSTLEHPNIVKTLSFGVSQDGQPYLVLEYLNGLSLAEDLKKNGRLSLQRFRDVFLPALSGLEQAHQAGLIHRDIKPGNIMICQNERGEEASKLLDFGIAKAFASESEAQNLTKTGALLGTPNYMSPEQCQGKPLDRRSDLYSMACVMYESLLGEPPFSGDSALEVMQKHSAAEPPTISELSRKIDIRKELATALLSGLTKDPAARPQTASEFAGKLNAVLERITLDKVPRLKSMGQESAGKKPLLVSLGAICLVAVFAFAWIWRSARSNSPVKSGLAQPQAEAQLVLNSARSHKEEKDEQQLKLALQKSETKFGADGSETITRVDNLAEFYLRHSKWSEAEQLLRRSLAVKEKEPSRERALTECLEKLSECCSRLNKYAESERLLLRSLKIKEIAVKQNSADEDLAAELAKTLTYLADSYMDQQKFLEAEPLYLRALKITKNLYPQDDFPLATLIHHLASCYMAQRRYTEAEPLFKQALEIRKVKNGPNNKDYAASAFQLGECRFRLGKFREAEPLFKRSMQIREKQYGAESKEFSTAVQHLGECYFWLGEYRKAEPFLQQSLERREKILPADRSEIANSLTQLGVCYLRTGNYKKATPLLERGRSLFERELGPGHPQLLVNNMQLADCYSLQGMFELAEPQYKRALYLTEKTYGKNSKEQFSIMTHLIQCYQKQNKEEEAQAMQARLDELGKKAK